MSPTKGRDYVESASKVFYCIKNDLELWFEELKSNVFIIYWLFINQNSLAKDLADMLNNVDIKIYYKNYCRTSGHTDPLIISSCKNDTDLSVRENTDE